MLLLLPLARLGGFRLPFSVWGGDDPRSFNPEWGILTLLLEGRCGEVCGLEGDFVVLKSAGASDFWCTDSCSRDVAGFIELSRADRGAWLGGFCVGSLWSNTEVDRSACDIPSSLFPAYPPIGSWYMMVAVQLCKRGISCVRNKCAAGGMSRQPWDQGRRLIADGDEDEEGEEQQVGRRRRNVLRRMMMYDKQSVLANSWLKRNKDLGVVLAWWRQTSSPTKIACKPRIPRSPRPWQPRRSYGLIGRETKRSGV